MPSVHRICSHCGESYPVEAVACPRCGRPVGTPPAVSGRQPVRALVERAAVPVALGVLSLAVRMGIRLFRHFLQRAFTPARQPGMADINDLEGSIIIDFWQQREVTDNRRRSVREQTRARWQIKRR